MQISATGTVMDGMTVAQKFRRKKKITITTRPTDSIRVNCTSSTEARMVRVRSTMMDGVDRGRHGGLKSAGSAALIRSTVSMTLAPGCLKTIRMTPALPFCQPPT